MATRIASHGAPFVSMVNDVLGAAGHSVTVVGSPSVGQAGATTAPASIHVNIIDAHKLWGLKVQPQSDMPDSRSVPSSAVIDRA
jgi:hypothetical protein